MDETIALSTRTAQHPNSQDREAWQALWAQQGQPWRTEPEIDAERQAELADRRSIEPNVEHGIYQFRRVKHPRIECGGL